GRRSVRRARPGVLVRGGLVGGAVPDRPALIGLDLRLRRDLGALQLDPEGGAAALRAGDPDAAAMLLHDRGGDREAEPRAAALGRRAHARGVRAVEALEHLLLLVGVDALPVV